MASEPSPRAIWNVKVAMNLLLFFVYIGLLLTGVATGAITYERALEALGTSALGGGMVWMALR